jgi:hypothetical protein
MINIVFSIVTVFKTEKFQIFVIKVIYYALYNYFKNFKFYNLIAILYSMVSI